ncbi:MAG: hypothetical protein RI957_2247 [Verrucomicrobiota bacterium]|jgi:hypothetical protein
MSSEPEIKPRVEIEAPSAAQIAAAKRMRRERELFILQKPNEEKKKLRRSGIEGVVLMLLAVALAYFLHPLGTVGWLLALLPFLGGLIVMLKGWQ